MTIEMTPLQRRNGRETKHTDPEEEENVLSSECGYTMNRMNCPSGYKNKRKEENRNK